MSSDGLSSGREHAVSMLNTLCLRRFKEPPTWSDQWYGPSVLVEVSVASHYIGSGFDSCKSKAKVKAALNVLEQLSPSNAVLIKGEPQLAVALAHSEIRTVKRRFHPTVKGRAVESDEKAATVAIKRVEKQISPTKDEVFLEDIESILSNMEAKQAEAAKEAEDAVDTSGTETGADDNGDAVASFLAAAVPMEDVLHRKEKEVMRHVPVYQLLNAYVI